MATSLPTYTGDGTALVQPTGNPVTDALIVGSKWGTGGAGTGAVVTFSFPDALDKFDTRAGVAGNYNPTEPTGGGYANYLRDFAPFGTAEQTATRQVLASWAAVANLQFTEVPATTVDAGVLRFGFSGRLGLGETTFGVSGFPQDFAGAGDTWMNKDFLFPEGWAPGTQNFLTMLHEVGHAIGLKHPHDTGMSGEPGWPVNPAVLPKTGNDTLTSYSTQNLVMAYNDLPGMGAPLQADFAPTTPMKVDIDAIQHVYGPNLAHNAGDTVYTYSSTVRYNETIWDGGGNDTIVVDGSADAAINLVPGTWSRVGVPLTFSNRNPDLTVAEARPEFTDPLTVYIYDTVTIENAVGGGGNDILIGNPANNRLQGGAGNDQLDGGLGIDLAVYSAVRADATLSRTAEGYTLSSSVDGADVLSGIERLQFSNVNVALDTRADQSAGLTVLLLGAALPGQLVFDSSKQLLLGSVIGLFDQGYSLRELSGALLRLPVWDVLTGQAMPSNRDIANYLLTNVNGSAPGQELLNEAISALNSEPFQGDWFAGLAGSSANEMHIGLVGLMDAGLEFMPPQS